MPPTAPTGDWSLDEVELIVADYFAMLEAELSGRSYSKTAHNRALQARIGRSRGSIEFKHCNISAVLVNFRQPFIAGYLPRQNYQQRLEQAVLEWLAGSPRFFQQLADGPVLAPAARPAIEDGQSIARLIEPPPEVATVGVEVDVGDERASRFYRTDFVRRDAENRRLGRMGEEWVLDLEQRRLHDDERRPDLAKKVEWTADVRGDGAGYDITSFNGDGSARLIEVKTTGLGKQFPNGPWCKWRRAPRGARRPVGKARRARILGIFERGATPPTGMHRASNAVATCTTAVDGDGQRSTRL